MFTFASTIALLWTFLNVEQTYFCNHASRVDRRCAVSRNTDDPLGVGVASSAQFGIDSPASAQKFAC